MCCKGGQTRVARLIRLDPCFPQSALLDAILDISPTATASNLSLLVRLSNKQPPAFSCLDYLPTSSVGLCACLSILCLPIRRSLPFLILSVVAPLLCHWTIGFLHIPITIPLCFDTVGFTTSNNTGLSQLTPLALPGASPHRPKAEDESLSMTAIDMIWQMPDQTIPTDDASPPVLNPPGILRSSSDSVVNSKIGPGEKLLRFDGRKSTSKEHPRLRDDVTVDTIEQGTLVVAARATSPLKAPPQPKTATLAIKAKQQHLQLPSFQALGIANPYPNSILTPPEEPTSLNWTSPDVDHTPTASSSIRSNIRTSNARQSRVPSNSILGASNDDSTPTQATSVGSLISPSVPSEQRPGSNSSNSSTATEVASNMPWLNQALGVVCE